MLSPLHLYFVWKWLSSIYDSGTNNYMFRFLITRTTFYMDHFAMYVLYMVYYDIISITVITLFVVVVVFYN